LHASQIGESFGMVLAEAHLNGIPIITLNTPLNDNTQNELIGNGRGGFVVTDQENMIKAIEMIANDKALGKTMGQAGATYIRNNYELKVITDKALTLCNILLKNMDRNQTIHALQENHIVTKVDQDIIKTLNENMMGKLSIKDRILSKIIHLPVFYKNYLKLKGIGA
jgi:dTDP-4-amino-4,6-dideoxygalactose transaminase